MKELVLNAIKELRIHSMELKEGWWLMADPVLEGRIHSMELKAFSATAMVALTASNPFNGIERDCSRCCVARRRLANPFNGIERDCSRCCVARRRLANPFNGIERKIHNSLPQTIKKTRNPFNGIERGIASASCLGVCVLGIHSMELKEFAR